MILFSVSVQAAMPKYISVQGRLSDAEGPVSGAYDFYFKIDNDAAGCPSPVWYNERENINLDNGVFNILIGSSKAISDSFDGPRYLCIAVKKHGESSYDWFSTSVPVSSSGYAYTASGADDFSVRGNLGVVGTSYTGKIRPYDPTSWTSSSADDEITIIKAGSLQNNQGGKFGIKLKDENGNTKAVGLYAVSEAEWSNSVGMAFYTGGNTAYTEKMRLTAGGNLNLDGNINAGKIYSNAGLVIPYSNNGVWFCGNPDSTICYSFHNFKGVFKVYQSISQAIVFTIDSVGNTATGGTLTIGGTKGCSGKLITDNNGLVYCGTDQTGTGGTTDHGALTGLGDDDHTQYVKKTGDTMSGDLTVSGGTMTTGKMTLGGVGNDMYLYYTGPTPGTAETETLEIFGNSEDVLNVQLHDGQLQFGTAPDVNLYRSAANVLKTDDSLAVGGSISSNGKAIVATGEGFSICGKNLFPESDVDSWMVSGTSYTGNQVCQHYGGSSGLCMKIMSYNTDDTWHEYACSTSIHISGWYPYIAHATYKASIACCTWFA